MLQQHKDSVLYVKRIAEKNAFSMGNDYTLTMVHIVFSSTIITKPYNATLILKIISGLLFNPICNSMCVCARSGVCMCV